MNSIITHAQQYVQQHPFELCGSVVIAAAFGLYLTWWKRAEDQDLDEEEAEENPTEKKPDQPTSGPTAKVTKVNRPPPPPPKDDLISAEFMAQCDGSNPDLPIYVAIRGQVFDVTCNKDAYGPGKGYNVFCGKDSSKALGKSSLKSEDCIPDVSELTQKELQTLDQWFTFFSKRYPIVGRLTD